MNAVLHNFRPKLLSLARQQGMRKRTIRLRRTKPKRTEKRQLQEIINEVIAAIYGYADELIAAATKEVPVIDSDGVVIGVFKDAVDDIDRLIQLVVTQTQQVATRVQVRVQDWSKRVEERHRREFTESVYDATKVHVGVLLHPSRTDRTVGHYVTWATSLIRDVGDEARKKIGHATLEAVRNRTPPAELSQTIREFEDMSYRRAKNIAADQTNKLNAALDQARQREAGIDHFTWVHSGSPHPRDWHLDRDGEVFSWDDNDIDEGDYPGEPPFCGCSAQATLVDETGQEIDGGEEGDAEDAGS
jgi:SPP1 gp7 family putative phage head morphogenesis protein